MPDGTTVVTQAKPKKNSRQKKRAKARRSAKQKANNERFTDASAYGKGHQTDPIYVQLAEITRMHTAYNFAVSDWCMPPRSIASSGEGSPSGWRRLTVSR
jgi:hypothetical protein